MEHEQQVEQETVLTADECRRIERINAARQDVEGFLRQATKNELICMLRHAAFEITALRVFIVKWPEDALQTVEHGDYLDWADYAQEAFCLGDEGRHMYGENFDVYLEIAEGGDRYLRCMGNFHSEAGRQRCTPTAEDLSRARWGLPFSIEHDEEYMRAWHASALVQREREANNSSSSLTNQRSDES